MGETRIASSKIGIEIDGLLKEALREDIVVRAKMPELALVGSPGVGAFGLAHGPLPLGVGDGRGDSNGRRLGNLVL